MASGSSSDSLNTHGKLRWIIATESVHGASSASRRAAADASASEYRPHISANGSSVSTLRVQRRPEGLRTRSAIEAMVPFISTTTIESRYTPPIAAGAPKPATDGSTPSWFQAKPPKRRERTSSNPAHRTGSTTTITAMRQP